MTLLPHCPCPDRVLVDELDHAVSLHCGCGHVDTYVLADCRTWDERTWYRRLRMCQACHVHTTVERLGKNDDL